MAKIAPWFRGKNERLRKEAISRSFLEHYIAAEQDHHEDTGSQIEEFLMRGGAVKKFDADGRLLPPEAT